MEKIHILAQKLDGKLWVLAGFDKIGNAVDKAGALEYNMCHVIQKAACGNPVGYDCLNARQSCKIVIPQA